MNSKILFLAFAACTLPGLGFAQNTGVQAQGNASAQGGASVQRDNGTVVQSSSSATGNASGTVSRGDKQVGADSGATTNAVLAGSLDAKKAKPGDPVSAKTSEQTTTADGVVLPKGTLSSSVGATGRALSGSSGAVGGVNARGMLSSESQGVFGLRGMNLSQSSAGSGSLVTSAGRNVQLDSGTRMLLSVQRSAAGTSQPK